MDGLWTPQEQWAVESFTGGSIIQRCHRASHVASIRRATAADEMMNQAVIYDHVAPLHSYELVAGRGSIGALMKWAASLRTPLHDVAILHRPRWLLPKRVLRL